MVLEEINELDCHSILKIIHGDTTNKNFTKIISDDPNDRKNLGLPSIVRICGTANHDTRLVFVGNDEDSSREFDLPNKETKDNTLTDILTNIESLFTKLKTDMSITKKDILTNLYEIYKLITEFKDTELNITDSDIVKLIESRNRYFIDEITKDVTNVLKNPIIKSKRNVRYKTTDESILDKKLEEYGLILD